MTSTYSSSTCPQTLPKRSFRNTVRHACTLGVIQSHCLYISGNQNSWQFKTEISFSIRSCCCCCFFSQLDITVSFNILQQFFSLLCSCMYQHDHIAIQVHSYIACRAKIKKISYIKCRTIRTNMQILTILCNRGCIDKTMSTHTQLK